MATGALLAVIVVSSAGDVRDGIDRRSGGLPKIGMITDAGATANRARLRRAGSFWSLLCTYRVVETAIDGSSLAVVTLLGYRLQIVHA